MMRQLTTTIVIFVVCSCVVLLGIGLYLFRIRTTLSYENGFKKIKGKSLAPPATEADIARLQAFAGTELPKDYLDFLRIHHGFQLSENSYVKWPAGSEPEFCCMGADISDVFPIGSSPEEYYGVIGKQDAYNFATWVDGDLLAIGRGWAHSIICISIRGDDYGCIYHFDFHSREADSTERSRRGVYLVAHTFREFWNKIEPVDVDAWLDYAGVKY